MKPETSSDLAKVSSAHVRVSVMLPGVIGIFWDRCNHRCFLGGAGEWAWEKFSASEMRILEKKMAIHSSILAWKILWPEEPGGLPGASTRDPTHDKVMKEKTWRARRIRFSRIPQRLAHEIPPMTRSWRRKPDRQGGSGFQGFWKAAPKLPPALTLKMVSVLLMLALIDYSLISVT